MIYVDELTTYHVDRIKQPARQYGRRWCHLSDTENDVARLDAFAKSIGIPKRWYQTSIGGTFPHYDLTPRYRLRAVAAGAVEFTDRRAAALSVEQVRTRRHFPKGDRRYGKLTDQTGNVRGVYSVPRVVGRRSGNAASQAATQGRSETRDVGNASVSDCGDERLPGF